MAMVLFMIWGGGDGGGGGGGGGGGVGIHLMLTAEGFPESLLEQTCHAEQPVYATSQTPPPPI